MTLVVWRLSLNNQNSSRLLRNHSPSVGCTVMRESFFRQRLKRTGRSPDLISMKTKKRFMIWRMMIGKEYQGMGYGQRAVSLAIEKSEKR